MIAGLLAAFPHLAGGVSGPVNHHEPEQKMSFRFPPFSLASSPPYITTLRNSQRSQPWPRWKRLRPGCKSRSSEYRHDTLDDICVFFVYSFSPSYKRSANNLRNALHWLGISSIVRWRCTVGRASMERIAFKNCAFHSIYLVTVTKFLWDLGVRACSIRLVFWLFYWFIHDSMVHSPVRLRCFLLSSPWIDT